MTIHSQQKDATEFPREPSPSTTESESDGEDLVSPSVPDLPSDFENDVATTVAAPERAASVSSSSSSQLAPLTKNERRRHEEAARDKKALLGNRLRRRALTAEPNPGKRGRASSATESDAAIVMIAGSGGRLVGARGTAS